MNNVCDDDDEDIDENYCNDGDDDDDVDDDDYNNNDDDTTMTTVTMMRMTMMMMSIVIIVLNIEFPYLLKHCYSTRSLLIAFALCPHQIRGCPPNCFAPDLGFCSVSDISDTPQRSHIGLCTDQAWRQHPPVNCSIPYSGPVQQLSRAVSVPPYHPPRPHVLWEARKVSAVDVAAIWADFKATLHACPPLSVD